MISLEASLRHMAWSNQKFLEFFTSVPTSVFALQASSEEWNIGRLLQHLLDSAEWYRYCLLGGELRSFQPITSASDAKDCMSIIAVLDQILIDNLQFDDEVLDIRENGNVFQASRALILTQAGMHASEHKGQIATILKANGFHLDLDELDVWSYFSEVNLDF
ncbi:MAG: hypothetical protein RIS75_474 [Actinomycetota bacterium]|jgi:uncharacterized damage-inducible protein DinB